MRNRLRRCQHLEHQFGRARIGRLRLNLNPARGTDSGAIELSQTVASPIYARSDSGEIRVKTAESGGYNVTVRTDNGRVDITGLTGRTSEGRETVGAIRGGGSVLDIESDSGEIQVL